jgi:hypothetical protein
MPATDNQSVVQVRFNEKTRNFFDELINCDLGNRKSDQGFIEVDRPMLKPRNGSTRVGNELISDWSSSTTYVVGDIVVYNDVLYKCSTWHTNSAPPSANWTVFTGWTSKLFFFTDRAWIRRAYRVFNNKLYYLNWATWTFLKDIGTTDIEFSQQRVPFTTSGSLNTEYTVPTESTTVGESIKKDASDTGGSSNIGKILLVTNGVYKGCYASIISYDSTTSEYKLWGAGIIAKSPSNTKYRIFDFVADALMITRWTTSQNEIFFDGVTELTHYEWYVTASLRQIAALTSTQTVSKLESFNNQLYTYAGSTLFYTGWFPWNPFFFNFTWALTLSGSWKVLDISVYKSRLIIIWTNFIYSLPTTLVVDRHVTSYGWVKNWYINAGEDVYILTTQWTWVSLNETINWVVAVKNIAQEIDNYSRVFKTNIACWFDWRKIYLYGQEDATSTWNMCVFDIFYKFWSVYTWLRPSSIVAEQWILYMTDNNSDIVRSMTWTVTNDVAVWTDNVTEFEQLIWTKEIDRNDVFTFKSLIYVKLLFENFSQEVDVDLYVWLNRKNGKRNSKKVNIDEIAVWGWTMGEWLIWLETLWTSWITDIISAPIMQTEAYANDPAYIFKLQISWPKIYMSQFDLVFSQDSQAKDYHNPNYTN